MKRTTIYETGEGSEITRYDMVVENLEVNDVQVSLRMSNFDTGWASSARGTEVVRAESDGNGVTVYFNGDESGMRLNYCQFEELRLVLHALAQTTDGYCQKLTKYEVIKK